MKTELQITTEPTFAEYEIKKSRFLGYNQPCASKEAAQSLLNQLKKARHHQNPCLGCHYFVLVELFVVA